MRTPTGRLFGRRGFPWRSPAGVGLLLSFFLPVLVLATVSAVSIRQRAETRRLLIQERYGAIADLVSSKLDEEMDLWHRELLAEIEDESWSERQVVARLHAAERKFAELRPLLMFATEGRVVYPLRARAATEPGAALEFGVDALEFPSGTFGWLLRRAQEAEFRDRDLRAAANLYRRAIRTATGPVERIDALNALGRVLLKSNDPADARRMYEQLIGLADVLDPRMGRWAVLGRVQMAAAQDQSGDTDGSWRERLETLRFLQRYRFQLDPDVHAFYRGQLQRSLATGAHTPSQQAELDTVTHAEQELDEIDQALQDLVRQVPQLLAAASAGWTESGATAPEPRDASNGDRPAAEWSVSYLRLGGARNGSTVLSRRQGTDWTLVRRWRTSSVKKMLQWLLQQQGPWQGNGVALLDPAGRVLVSSTSATPADWVGARIEVTALPGWRIVAYPADSSLAAEARRDVIDYAVLLGAAFLAVVASLVVATRTLSRQVALARARADFVSNVSHELKTPLSLIRMFAENLLSGWVSEDKKPEYYRVMLGESERLSCVIDNALDFSRIESGRRQYQLRPTDLRPVVQEILERYRYSFDTAGIRLSSELPDGPVEVRADPEGIAQVLVNLLSNASKYIGDGERQVQVSLSAGDTEVTITVADTGVGMSAEAIDKIFAPFCRIDDPAVRAVAGSGIGLTIVRHIVEAHGGRVSVSSRPGRGSTFRVVLPK